MPVLRKSSNSQPVVRQPLGNGVSPIVPRAIDEPPNITVSTTTASEFQSNSFMLAPPSSAPSSTVFSLAGGGFGVNGPFEVPRPPKLGIIDKEKACPYCYLVLPAKIFEEQKNTKRWKRHLLEDLQPYICLFANCDRPGKSYSSFKDWQKHLDQPHYDSWVCRSHSDDGVSLDGEPLLFNKLADFDNHLNAYHPNLDRPAKNDLVHRSTQVAMLPQWCFVCFENHSSLPAVQKHMAHHLRPMSLLALPWLDDIEQEQEFASDKSMSERHSSDYSESFELAELPDRVDLADEILWVLDNNPIGLSPEGVYLPDDDYVTLLRRNRIRAALGGGHEVSALVKYILNHAKKAFATLVLVFPSYKDRRDVMASLTEKEFNGTILESYEIDPLYFQHRLWNERTIDDFKNKRLSFILPMFDIDVFKYEFDKKQILPFTVIDEANTPSRSGHFSEVECVEMLASKQNKINVSGKTVRVALKKLKIFGDPGYNIHKEWEREARAHQQLNCSSEKIIQAFAAYRQIGTNRQLDEYYLVLEWANGGSLFDFWENNPEPQVDCPDVGRARRRVKELLGQLHGLAEALEAMHSTSARTPGNNRKNSASNSPRLQSERTATWEEDAFDNGGPYVDSSSLPTFNFVSEEERNDNTTTPSILVSSDTASSKAIESSDSLYWFHSNIRPENVLRFTTGQQHDKLGILKLADLGRAQQHPSMKSMSHTKEMSLWRTQWYDPPDLEKKNHEEAQGRISPLSDIWSMGCLIFEAIRWLIHGHESHTVFLRANGFNNEGKRATPYWRGRGDGSYG